MSSKYNRKKSEQLGMPYGTACGRLRKNILFALVQETERDVCFKCGEVIESVEDLSIEHKVPWLDNDAELFWDLSNIAFSHIECNKPDNPSRPRVQCPPGTSWCYKCKQFKPLSEFHKRSARWNGVCTICCDCKGVKTRRSQKKPKEKKEKKQKSCRVCGETDIEKLVLNRMFCTKCYNEHQRKIMAERRKTKQN